MAVSFAKTYAGSDTAGFIADFTAAWSWAATDHEEDSTEWDFYIDDEKTKGFKISVSNDKTQIEVLFCGNTYFSQTASTYVMTRFTTTSTCFVLDWCINAGMGTITPQQNYKYIICTGVDQETGEEEKTLAYCNCHTSLSNGWSSILIASDMANKSININKVDALGSNTSAELTVIQPMFSKSSKFAAKDAFTVTATQLSTVAYGGVTLAGKSYYMCGWVLIEDN